MNKPLDKMPTAPGMRGGGPSARFMQQKVRPKETRKTISRLLKFFKGQIGLLALAVGFVAISASVTLIGPYLIGKSIDLLNSNADFSKLKLLLFGLISVYLFDSLSNFSQGWIVASVSQKIVQAMRRTLFEKLQKLEISYFDRNPHGEVMSRLSNDTDNIASVLGTAITQLFSMTLVLSGTFVMMLVLSPVMTLFSLVSVPLFFVLTKTITSKTRTYFREQQKTLGQLNAQIEESITGMSVIKAYSHEKYVISDFEKVNERLREVSTSAQVWSGYVMPIMNVINNFSFTIVAGAGAILSINGYISVGVIATFISYSRQFGRPLNDLAATYNQFQSALASSERVFDIIDEKPEPADPKEAKVITQTKGEVTFKNVSFGYKKEEMVLKNVSFHVPSGATVALVGPTGAGKTTIVNLVSRFYDVSNGEIEIDGINITNYTRSSLRQLFGMVLQDTYLFTGSIRENILYGKQNATDEEMVNAAKSTGAHHFISRLPKGYDTILSENSSTLSQGQRQLLAISRAILSNPQILVLDEATSSVDTRTELRIQSALAKLMKGRTSFVIAHRLSTVMNADIIMVIDHGELVEIGKPDELLAQDGNFKRMFEMQMKGVSIDS